MIYSKTKGGSPNHAGFRLLTPLSEAKLEPNSIYWYDQHDLAIRCLEFSDFIEEKHWDHVRKDPTTKILLFYGNEYFNLDDIERFSKTIKEKSVPEEQVYIVTINEPWTQWARKYFAEKDLTKINITDYNLMLTNLKRLPIYKGPVQKKFSALSRNYNEWRLKVFAEFRKRDLLKDFRYSFHNISPYQTPLKVYEVADIKNTLNSFGYTSPEVQEWADKIPYQLDPTFLDKWNDATFKAIQSAHIHLLIESHFDPFWNFHGRKGQVLPEVYSPAFITEKTYKVIFSKRPFISFSTPYYMKEMKELGFKTFSPFINESYDDIVDDDQRLLAIAGEFERLSKLDEESFNKVLKDCEAVCEHNFNLLLEMRKNVRYTGNFAWANEHIYENNVENFKTVYFI